MNFRKIINNTIILTMTGILIVSSVQGYVKANDVTQPLGENVALGKTITIPEVAYTKTDGTEDTGKKNSISKILDGNIKDGFQAVTTTKIDPQIWVVDLEQIYSIDKIKLYWQDGARGTKYKIYASTINSDKPEDWSLVATVENGVSQVVCNFEEVEARYIKLDLQEKASNYGYYLYEIEVFTVGSTEPVEVENLALKAKATVSAYDGNNVAERAIDGNNNTYWQAPMYVRDDEGNILKDENGSNIKLTEEELNTPFITIEWEEEQYFNGIQLDWNNGYLKEYKIQISKDGVIWEDIYQVTDGFASDSRKILLDKPVTSKYLRLQGVKLGAYRAELREFQVYDETNIPVDKININKSRVMLNCDDESRQKVQLEVNVNPSNATDKSVNWTSEDESIAIVDETGLVTAVKAGITTVVATSVSNPEIKVECKIVVATAIEKSIISATKIEGKKDIHISWTRIDNAVGYEVYRVKELYEDSESGVRNETKIYEGTDLSYVDRDLSYGHYKYFVKAIANPNDELLCDSISDDCKEVIIPLDVTGIEITKKEIEIYIGDSETVKATVLPTNATNKNLIWSSNNENIVTVDKKGMITAIAEGTAIITVTTEDGGYTDTCIVNTIPVDATAVILNKTKVTLELNNSVELYASILPLNATYKDVIWSSDNAKVATVDKNGIVTAKAAGKAIVTATSISGAKDECEINVRVSPKKIELNKQTLELAPGETSLLSAVITPKDATEKEIIWSTDNRDVVWVNEDGNVIAISTGTATVSAITVNGGLVATCTVTVKKKENSTTANVTEAPTTEFIEIKAPVKAKINKIYKKKKISNKVKLSIKNIKGVIGYQIKVLKTKKAKKAVITKIVKRTKVTIKSKKIKNKKKLFVKVRAYVLDANGKKLYGKWSNIKKVNIKR